jgi:N-acetylglucosaminyldiphosphoundecaprenol N-acetyl-beta-D-mannosaminyltransferase
VKIPKFGWDWKGEAVSVECQRPLESRYILQMRVDATTYGGAVERVIGWAGRRESRYVCCANVHSVMESFDNDSFRRCINSADLVTSDGMPLVWALRRLGVSSATRVYGPDLVPALLRAADRAGLRVGFYGGTPDTLSTLLRVTEGQYPGLIGYGFSPPFRELTPEEDQTVVDRINRSGVQILFVGLGCPKQEKWMADHQHRIRAVMLGVGAAFDFLAGMKAQAPAWLQAAGLEWLFRLAVEPKRLWRRYLKHNPRFVAHFMAQLVSLRYS